MHPLNKWLFFFYCTRTIQFEWIGFFRARMKIKKKMFNKQENRLITFSNSSTTHTYIYTHGPSKMCYNNIFNRQLGKKKKTVCATHREIQRSVCCTFIYLIYWSVLSTAKPAQSDAFVQNGRFSSFMGKRPKNKNRKQQPSLQFYTFVLLVCIS